jgi:outer membrane protein assembly factor BamB
VIEQGRLYVYFGTFGAACIDTQTGTVVWTNREHRIMHENGPGSSPVLFGDKLIFHCDGSDKQYITALDKQSGKTVWKTDRSGEMRSDPQLKKAYGTPLIVSIEGKSIVVSPASDWLYGYAPETGKELWKMNYGVLGFSIVPRPVESHGLVYFCTSFMQSQLMAVKCSASETPKIVWEEKKSVPTMPSPLVAGEEIYMVSDNGGILTCMDAKTGKVHYRQRIEGKHCASPLLADGRIYLCDREGTTVVVKPGPKFEELARNKLAAGIMASPAAVDGALFIRTEQALYRIEAKK